jgi:hypothetical protein
MKFVQQIVLVLFTSILGLAAFAQSPVVTNPSFGDDTYVHIPLQFGFPFYGRTFTNSWMHSNGVVSFLDPAVPIPNAGHNPGAWAYCCEGVQPTTTMPQFSYMIAPLWTDLYPVGISSFRTEGTNQYQRYEWNNIAEISNMNNLNTFSVEIRPSGFIGVNYTAVNIQNQRTWSGTIGNPTLGEWNQIYYGFGVPGQSLNNWSVNETIGVDICSVSPTSSPSCPGYTEAMCATNPLHSTSCSGYAAAILSQQCAINTLYDPACPGYATAYYNYQCSANPLYHTGCQGYDAAYFNQQCSLDPLYNQACAGYDDAYYVQQCNANALYDSGCTGYDAAYFNQQCNANALYDSGCTGYDAAYFDQQCSLNTLYNNQCPGYDAAYFDQQCSLNTLYNNQCPGYDAAYFDQQCNANALYDSTCPGYEKAYFDQQCSLNTLYNNQCPGYDVAYFNQQCNANTLYNNQCPGYDVAYFNQQCGINGLYDRTCPNYGESYAKQNVLSVVASEPIVESVTVEQIDVKTEPAEIIKEVAQLESPKTEVAAAVVVPITSQEKPKNDAAPSPTTSTSAPPARGTEASSSEKNKPKTNRQAIIERRQAAAKEKAAESGDKMAGEMQSADSMEKQVELQNVVLQVMGFTPGFDAYLSLVVPDGQMYKPFTIYDKQKNVDSRAGSRLFGGTDNTHRQMVDAQYQIGN